MVFSTAENTLPSEFIEKERYTLEKRMAELSGKVRKLFDEHASCFIDDGNHKMLRKEIQTEQATLEQKLSVLRSRLQNNQNTEA